MYMIVANVVADVVVVVVVIVVAFLFLAVFDFVDFVNLFCVVIMVLRLHT